MTTNLPTVEVDCRGLQCPAPVIRLAREAAGLRASGGIITMLADDPAFKPDVEAWARTAKAQLLEFVDEGDHSRAVLQVGGGPAKAPGAPPPPPRAPAARAPAAPAARAPAAKAPGTLAQLSVPSVRPAADVSLDLRGVPCPGPVISLAKTATQHPAGTEVHVVADDPAFPIDLRSWLQAGHAELLELDDQGPEFHARLRVSPTRSTRKPVSAAPATGSALAPTVDSALAPLAAPETERRCTLLVLHNDHEALLAALLVANGAAAQGMQTSLFFTFWGLNLLRGDHPDPTAPREPVTFMQRMMKWMMPKGPTRQKMGKMHFAGVGKGMLNSIMRSQNILGLPELMRSAQELGVTFTACTMSMSVMGITKRDLYPYPNLEYAGVATFVERAEQSSIHMVF